MPVAAFNFSLSEAGRQVFSERQGQTFDETGYISYELATATTDEAIPFTLSTGVTTITSIVILSDQTITYKQVAGDTGEQITANRPFIHWGTSVTAVVLSNASGSTAFVHIWIGGT